MTRVITQHDYLTFYKYKGIGSCGGFSCGGGFTTVTTMFSGREGWHGHGIAINFGTSSPGIITE
jgi:hypothetical protein